MEAQTQKKVAPRRVAPRRVSPEGWGAQNFALFFNSSATIFFLLSLSWGPCVEFWWCLKRRALKCARLEFSGCRVRAPPARSGGAAGVSHDSPRAQMCTSGFRRFKNPTKIQRKDPQERERRMKIVAGGEKKKSEILGGPAEGSGGGAVRGRGPGEHTNLGPNTHSRHTQGRPAERPVEGPAEGGSGGKWGERTKHNTQHTTTHNNTQQQHTHHTLMLFFFVPSSVFYFVPMSFFCPACLFCPVCPFFLSQLAQLTDPARRPKLPRAPIPREFMEHNPLEQVALCGEALLKNLRSSRRGAAGGPSAASSGDSGLVKRSQRSHALSPLGKFPTRL